MPSSRSTIRASREGIMPSRAWLAMPPERTSTRSRRLRSSSIRSRSTCAITLRQVLAWQTRRMFFNAPPPAAPTLRCDGDWRGSRPGGCLSPLLPRPLPEAHALAEILPLLLGPLVEGAAEVGAGRLVEAGAEGLGQEFHQLFGVEPAISVDPADGLRLSEDGVAVAEGVEDLPVDVSGRVAREEDNEGGNVVGVALRADGLLARPLAGFLEDLFPARSRVDHAGGAARHDGIGGHAVLGHGVRRRPHEPDDACLAGGVVGLA